MAAQQGTRRYRWTHTAMMRATTFPTTLGPLPDVDLSGPGGADRGAAWLSEVWSHGDIRRVVGEASPSLSQRIETLLSGAVGDLRDVRAIRRMVVSLASYLLRWEHRPTPFGRFAGVAAVQIGSSAKVRWGDEHRVSARADADWLDQVIRRLLQSSELKARLRVVANDAGHVRGDRFVAPGSPPAGASSGLAPVEVSVRYTRPVRTALQVAQTPIPFGELHKRLIGAFPGAAPEQIDRLLDDLLAQGLLISCFQGPMTDVAVLEHICAELEAAGAGDLPDIRGLVHELHDIRRDLSTDHVDDASKLTDRMRALATTARVPFGMDTQLDCDVTVPEQVAQAARDAASVLYRLTPYPVGYPQWRDYHSRFRARYGSGALVPVMELVADSGLGLPAEYLGSAYGRAARQLTERDETLLRLVQKAMLDATGEIMLTNAVIDELAPSPAEDALLPSRTEIAVEIHSSSSEALSRGDFRLTVTGTPRPGSSMAGRLAHLLPEHNRSALAETYASRHPGVIAAQLSFRPRKQRNENVTRTARLLPHVIPVAEYRAADETLIPLSDLAVGADARQFYLVRISTGQLIEPRVLHALEAGIHTPPLARFLAEVCTARCAVYQGFNFGAASRLPYLPRVRFRQTVLAPARWLLSTADLPGRGVSADTWAAGLEAYRARVRMPDSVALVEQDRRIPLHLDRHLDRLVLRTRLDRAGYLELRETAGPEDFAWLGRAHELLVPLALDQQHVPGPRKFARPILSYNAAGLPGRGDFVYAQQYGHPARFDEVITDHLPALLKTLDGPTPWWFRRHREMTRPEADQYLALYLHLPDGVQYGLVAEQVREWAEGLRDGRLLAQLTLATYEPQTGRFGHGAALDAAHNVFAADSAVSAMQIRIAGSDDRRGQALAAISIVDLAVEMTGSTGSGIQWLINELPREHGRLDPALRDAAFELATFDGAVTPISSELEGAWRARGSAVASYRQALSSQHRDPSTVIRSLLHLHHVRAVGVDPDRERTTQRLARAYALRMRAQQSRGQ